MTQQSQTNHIDTLIVPITNTLRQRYLLDTSTARHIDLRFLHQHAQTTSDISILIVARAGAIVNLSATVSIPVNLPDCQTNLDIQIVAMDNAVVTAAPNLEIANNQVSASHSLSTTHLDDNELFYLASRGIDNDQTQELLINSYLNKFNQAIRL